MCYQTPEKLEARWGLAFELFSGASFPGVFDAGGIIFGGTDGGDTAEVVNQGGRCLREGKFGEGKVEFRGVVGAEEKDVVGAIGVEDQRNSEEEEC